MPSLITSPRINFSARMITPRTSIVPTSGRCLFGQIPTIAITPVADGRTGAYEANQAKTWAMVHRVQDLIKKNVFLPDGTPVRIVVAPEIVYGAATGARAQEYYTKQGVSANIYVSRSWAYSDELMSAIQGLGSSEWQIAGYGLNATDRPGAVWLKAMAAAMEEKRRAFFSIYNPHIEKEDIDIPPYVAERLLRFARCAMAVAEMRGKNYLSVGGVSMGIIGSDVRRNIMLHTFGMGCVSVDMSELAARMDEGFYDHEEAEQAFRLMKKNFNFDWGKDKRPQKPDALLRDCIAMTLIVRDLMEGNPRLADPKVAKKQGFKADVERAQGHNAILAGTQGQRAWTDHHPNFDMVESLLCSFLGAFGFKVTVTSRNTPRVVATENDSKNGIGMLAGFLLTGLPQLFADIRTNWTPESIHDGTSVDVTDICPRGIIDKRNSGAGALEYAVNPYKIAGLDPQSNSPQELAQTIRSNPGIQQKLINAAIRATIYMGANLQYFPGDGLSSHFRTPGGLPMTSYRYSVVDNLVTCSVIEGETVELPVKVADYISRVTDCTWPESYWQPRGMTSFQYMDIIGPNHDGNGFGLFGADLMTLNAMLRVPVDFHNIPPYQIFRPTIWNRFGGDDFRACEFLGSLYK